MATVMIHSFTRAGAINRCHAHRIYRIQQRYSSQLTSYVVSPKQAYEAIFRPATKTRAVPVCGAWLMPGQAINGYHLFKDKRIPGARFFDLDKIKDEHSPYPHMLPEPEAFAEAMRNLGIERDDAVIVYDTAEMGLFSAPRVSWTFRVFGHPKVHILNNFALWCEQGYPVESGKPEQQLARTGYPVPELDESKVAEFEEVKRLVSRHPEGTSEVQLLDARSKERFSGGGQEPRAGLPSGHMPGAINIPYSSLLDPATKALLPKDQLRKVLEGHNLDPNKPIISTCGTGVTAAVLDAALEEAGIGDAQNRKVYDGSWTEWAMRVGDDKDLVRTSTG